MQTYKITFHMGNNAVAFSQDIMFDGIIAYAYHRENAPNEHKNVGKLSFTKQEKFDFSNMPLERHEKGYFLGSWLMYDKNNIVHDNHTLLKKWDEESDYMAEFGKAKRAVFIDRGEFKTKQIPINSIQTPSVWFYFRTNQVEEIKRLIDRHITGIGKKISRGYGFFEGYEIEELRENVFESQILRPIPISKEDIKNLTGKWKVEYRAWTFPYWLPENFAQCRVG